MQTFLCLQAMPAVPRDSQRHRGVALTQGAVAKPHNTALPSCCAVCSFATTAIQFSELISSTQILTPPCLALVQWGGSDGTTSKQKGESRGKFVLLHHSLEGQCHLTPKNTTSTIHVLVSLWKGGDCPSFPPGAGVWGCSCAQLFCRELGSWFTKGCF